MIQLKYILSFAALLAYVGAYTPPTPGSKGAKCSSDKDCNDSLMCDDDGTCQKLGAKGEYCGGMGAYPGCLPGLECKQEPAGKCRKISDSIQKRSKKSLGRKKCQNGGGAESKEGQPCATDAECGHGFECGDRIANAPGRCESKSGV